MYIDVARKTPCRAKNPKKCRFHGALADMDAALARGDRGAYLKARIEMESVARTLPEAAGFVAELEAEQAEMNARLDEQEQFEAIWEGAVQDERHAHEVYVAALEQSTDGAFLAQEWARLAADHDGKPPVDAETTYALVVNPHTPQGLVVGYVEDLDALESEAFLTDAPGKLPADVAARLLARHGLDHNNEAIAYAAIAHLDAYRAEALAFHDEGTFQEFLVHHGWVDGPEFEAKAVALVQRRHLGRDDWSQTLPALGRHGREESTQLLVANQGNAQARRELAESEFLRPRAAAALVGNADDFDLTNYDQLRDTLHGNEALPVSYRAVFDETEVAPVSEPANSFEVERLQHAHESYAAARQTTKTLWESTGKDHEHWLAADRVEETERVAYLNALAAVDAHKANFELLTAGKGNARVRRGLRVEQVGAPEMLTKHVFLPHRLAAAKNYLLRQQDMRAGFLAL